jgi:hypothetical protein
MIETIAKIESTFLGIEDHGILTCSIGLNYGHSAQGFGQYSWDQRMPDGSYKGSPLIAIFIRKVLEVAGVDQWEKLVGKTIFALHNDGDPYGLVRGIKSLPTEGNREFVFDTIMNDK